MPRGATLEKEGQQLREQNRRLEEALLAIEGSAGWRMLKAWRLLRNGVAPEKSVCRKAYDFFVNILRR